MRLIELTKKVVSGFGKKVPHAVAYRALSPLVDADPEASEDAKNMGKSNALKAVFQRMPFTDADGEGRQYQLEGIPDRIYLDRIKQHQRFVESTIAEVREHAQYKIRLSDADRAKAERLVRFCDDANDSGFSDEANAGDAMEALCRRTSPASDEEGEIIGD